MIIESPLDLIFRDLFYRLRNFAGSHDVFLKLEGFNVTGSIKIKTAIGLVEDLERRGIAKPNETVIVESSSGNLGIALSLICAGTTGTIGGVSERLRQVFPSIKVIAVEPFGSVTFGGEAGKRDIPGIGTSVRPKLADLTNPDRVVEISEARTVETCLSFVWWEEAPEQCWRPW
jgi:cysteine synthase